MTKESFLGFIAACIGSILAVALVTYLAMFFNIWLPNARNETLPQKLYNRCLTNTSYKTAESCKYVLEAKTK